MAMNVPVRPTPALGNIAILGGMFFVCLCTCSVQASVSLSYACDVYQSSFESLKWQ